MDLSVLLASIDASPVTPAVLFVAAVFIGIRLVTYAVDAVNGQISEEDEDDDKRRKHSKDDDDDDRR